MELAEYSTQIEQVWLGMHGEPFIDVKLAEKVDLCRRHGLKTIISTNGSLVTSDRAASVLEAGAGTVIFSLESLDRSIYERIRVGLNHSEVVTNIKGFIDLKIKGSFSTGVVIRCVESEWNQNNKQEFIDYWAPYLRPEIGGIEFTPINNWAHGRPGRSHGTTPCRQVMGMTSILSDGTVSLCCIDYEKVYTLGNVENNTIREIVNGEGARKLREIHESGRRDTLRMCDTCYLPELWDEVRPETYGESTRIGDMERSGWVSGFGEMAALQMRNREQS
jgi:radical SAM protein with 4Fe4S-binding SPASM domain